MHKFIVENYVSNGAMARRLKKDEVVCVVSGDSFKIKESIGNLIVIFDNLVINSEYWLNTTSAITKTIFFDCDKDGVVRYWDSGYGISKEIENTLLKLPTSISGARTLKTR